MSPFGFRLLPCMSSLHTPVSPFFFFLLFLVLFWDRQQRLVLFLFNLPNSHADAFGSFTYVLVSTHKYLCPVFFFLECL